MGLSDRFTVSKRLWVKIIKNQTKLQGGGRRGSDSSSLGHKDGGDGKKDGLSNRRTWEVSQGPKESLEAADQ